MLGMEWNEVEIPMELEESAFDTEQGKLAMNLLLVVKQKAGLPLPPAWLSPAMLWHRITTDWLVTCLHVINMYSNPFCTACHFYGVVPFSSST